MHGCSFFDTLFPFHHVLVAVWKLYCPFACPCQVSPKAISGSCVFVQLICVEEFLNLPGWIQMSLVKQNICGLSGELVGPFLESRHQYRCPHYGFWHFHINMQIYDTQKSGNSQTSALPCCLLYISMCCLCVFPCLQQRALQQLCSTYPLILAITIYNALCIWHAKKLHDLRNFPGTVLAFQITSIAHLFQKPSWHQVSCMT